MKSPNNTSKWDLTRHLKGYYMKVWQVGKIKCPNFQGIFWHLLTATRHISCSDTALAHHSNVTLLLRHIRNNRFETEIKVLKREKEEQKDTDKARYSE
jgi:hypothetical protein